MSIDLDRAVTDAMDNARENGVTFAGWTDYEVALDLITYDADLEDQTVEAILPFVQLYRARQ